MQRPRRCYGPGHAQSSDSEADSAAPPEEASSREHLNSEQSGSDVAEERRSHDAISCNLQAPIANRHRHFLPAPGHSPASIIHKPPRLARGTAAPDFAQRRINSYGGPCQRPSSPSSSQPHRPSSYTHTRAPDAMSQPAPPAQHYLAPDLPFEVKARAGSGRSSLGRRRRFEEYAGTIEADRLADLDNELLSTAALYRDVEDLDEDVVIRPAKRAGPEVPLGEADDSLRFRRGVGRRSGGTEDEEDEEELGRVSPQVVVDTVDLEQELRESRGVHAPTAAGSTPVSNASSRFSRVPRSIAAPPDATYYDPRSGNVGDIPDKPGGVRDVNYSGAERGGTRFEFPEEEEGERGSGTGATRSDADRRRVRRASTRFWEWVNGAAASPPPADAPGEGASFSQQSPAAHMKGSGELLRYLNHILPTLDEETRKARAGLYLTDGIDARPVRFKVGKLKHIYCYRLRHRSFYRHLLQLLSIVHLLLALWEPSAPPSIHRHPYHTSFLLHTLTHPTTTALHLLGFEFFLILLFLTDCVIEMYSLGITAYFGLKAPPRILEHKGRGAVHQAKIWSQFRLLLVVCFFVDVVSTISSPQTSPRFSRPLRPLYLICLSETLKKWTILLYQLFVSLRDVALSINIMLLLYALLSLILFSETPYYTTPTSLQYFNYTNYVNSFITTYLLLTTQTFSTLLNPAYLGNPAHGSPLYFLYYLSFLFSTVLFLTHLILPRVYWTFQKYREKQTYESALLGRLALLASFKCLDPHHLGYITYNNWTETLRFIRPDLYNAHTGHEHAVYSGVTQDLYHQLAKRKSELGIFDDEWLNVCSVILTDYEPVSPLLPSTPFSMTHPDCYHRGRARFRIIMASHWLDLVAMVLLCLTCFFLTFYGSPSVDNAGLRNFAYFTISIFTLEMFLRLWTLGIRIYLKQTANLIDVCSILPAFCLLLTYGFSSPQAGSHSSQMANLPLLFLTLRLIRLFPKCSIFHKLSSAFRVIKWFLCSIALLSLLTYTWAIIGMAIFAGHSDRVTDIANPDLLDYASVDNFGDIWSAFVMLFQVATTYSWYKIMYLWMFLSGSTWAALYFIAFHILSRLLIYQLTAALFIDAFLCFRDKRWLSDSDEVPTETTIRERRSSAFLGGGGQNRSASRASSFTAEVGSRVASAPSRLNRSRSRRQLSNISTASLNIPANVV